MFWVSVFIRNSGARCALALLPLVALLPVSPGWAEVSIVDDAGRTVALAEPATRVVLTDGMGFVALALLDDHPDRLLAGWNRVRMDGDMLEGLRTALPGIDAVPDIGEPGASAASLEKVISLDPDLVVLDPFYDRSPATLAAMRAAGIAVAVLALTPSIREPEPMSGLMRLGSLLGREQRAKEFSRFVDDRLASIRNRVTSLADNQRPPVFFEPHAARDACCMSMGGGRGIGDFVGLVGGRNIGSAALSGMAGPLSLEYIIGIQPQVYIGTGGRYMAGRGGLVVGPSFSEDEARRSLAGVLSRKGFGSLPAVTNGRAFGLSHGLAISAINIVAIEAMAGWLHPELFGDLDPQATLDEIGERFLPTRLPGKWWIGVRQTEALR